MTSTSCDEAVAVLAEAVMEAEVAAQARRRPNGERSPERITLAQRVPAEALGHTRRHHRDADPEAAPGQLLPFALLEPSRRRAERALLAVVQQAYVEGVSTRRVDDLVRSLGCEGISKSQVDRGSAPSSTTVVERASSSGRSTAVRTATSGSTRSPSGCARRAASPRSKRRGRHMPSTPTASARCWALTSARARTGPIWLSFLRGLVARGLSGVELVTSDAHQGLKAAIATVFGGASWQRCRTHFMRNLTRVPKSAEALVATTVRTIFQQPSAEAVHAQHARVVEQLDERFPAAAAMLDEAAAEVLAFTACPVAHWKQVWSNNPQERLNLARSAGAPTWSASSPTAPRSCGCIGAVLAEQHDEWAVPRGAT